jgi:hypothetical protein
MSSTLEKRTAQYHQIKGLIAAMDERHEAEKAPLLKIKECLEGYMAKFLDETGQQTAVTPAGTVHWNTRTTVSLSDPQAFMDFVVTNKNFELLDRKANATAVKDYMIKTNAEPPGVKLNTIKTVGVKQPTAKQREKNAATAAVTEIGQ